MDEKNLGKNIRNYRAAAGLTQDELADTLGLSRQAISAYERGNRIPTDLPALADALGISIDELYADESSVPDRCFIETLLNRKHMSWLDLYKKTGVSIGHLKAAQALRLRLDDDVLRRIANALGCNTTDLYSNNSIAYKTAEIALRKEAVKGLRIIVCVVILVPALFTTMLVLSRLAPGRADLFGRWSVFAEIALLPVLIIGLLKYMGLFTNTSGLTADDVVLMDTKAMVAARELSGLSVRTLSKKCGVSDALIKKAERGRTVLGMDDAISYAEAVGISVDEFFL